MQQWAYCSKSRVGFPIFLSFLVTQARASFYSRSRFLCKIYNVHKSRRAWCLFAVLYYSILGEKLLPFALWLHPCKEEDPFMRMWLSQQGPVVLCLWILFPWHSCPLHTTLLKKKSAATLGNKASLAGLLLLHLKLCVVIVIFRPHPSPLPPGNGSKEAETVLRLGQMQGEVRESPSSSDSSLLFSLWRYGNDYITWDGECSVGLALEKQ